MEISPSILLIDLADAAAALEVVAAACCCFCVQHDCFFRRSRCVVYLSQGVGPVHGEGEMRTDSCVPISCVLDICAVYVCVVFSKCFSLLCLARAGN